MIRLATEDDLYWLAERLYQLRFITAWAQHDMSEYTISNLVDFIVSKLDDPNSVIFIDGTSVCGASLGQFIYPPFYPHITEWMWTGEDKRATARCLQAAFQWGKEHGAVFGGYVLATPGKSPDWVDEQWVWRRL